MPAISFAIFRIFEGSWKADLSFFLPLHNRNSFCIVYTRTLSEHYTWEVTQEALEAVLRGGLKLPGDKQIIWGAMLGLAGAAGVFSVSVLWLASQ